MRDAEKATDRDCVELGAVLLLQLTHNVLYTANCHRVRTILRFAVVFASSGYIQASTRWEAAHDAKSS